MQVAFATIRKASCSNFGYHSSYLLTTENPSSTSLSLPSCQNQVRFRVSCCGGMLLKGDQTTIKVATAYVPPVLPLGSLHPGTVLLLKPRSGVLDTVSRSHLDRSRITALLKSRFAVDWGVLFFPRLVLPPAKVHTL